MTLYKLEDFYPNYKQDLFEGEDIKGVDVYAGATDEKIGTVHTALVDGNGRFRYFVIDTGFWIFGKKVLLPVGQCRIDEAQQRLYATGLTNKNQAEQLPEYREDQVVEYDYEEQVRSVYRTPTVSNSVAVETSAPAEVYTRSVEDSIPVEMTAPLDTPSVSTRRAYTTPSVENSLPVEATPPINGTYGTDTTRSTQTPYVSTPAVAPAVAATPPARDRKTYSYDHEPNLYELNPRDHQKLRLYEERLITTKNRQKTGEVIVNKRVETDIAKVEVPVTHERVVIEHSTPTHASTPVTTNPSDFRNQEIARLEVYEETADIRKEAVLREEVRVTKEVDREVVEAEEKIRREKLDIKQKGNPVIEQQNPSSTRR